MIIDAVLKNHGAPPELLREVNALYNDELSIYVHRMSDGQLWEGSNGPVFASNQLSVLIEQYERSFRLLCRLIDAVIPGTNVAKMADRIQFKKNS